jgi:hypothetical protein
MNLCTRSGGGIEVLDQFDDGGPDVLAEQHRLAGDLGSLVANDYPRARAGGGEGVALVDDEGDVQFAGVLKRGDAGQALRHAAFLHERAAGEGLDLGEGGLACRLGAECLEMHAELLLEIARGGVPELCRALSWNARAAGGKQKSRGARGSNRAGRCLRRAGSRQHGA